MGKKSKSKAGGDFWDDEIDAEEVNESQEFGGAESRAGDAGFDDADEGDGFDASKAPQVADMDDEWGDNGLMGALKKSKKRKDQRAEEKEAQKDEASNEPVVQVKTKKEKEREKKEREKAKKKAQAARKAASAPQKPKKPAAAETTEDDVEAPEAAEAAEAAAEADVPAEPAAGKKKGKKKVNAAVAAIQKAQAARLAKEAEAKKQAEEEARRAEEEARKEEEEELKAEEARQLKREKKKAKEDELKRQGKFLTKKQKEQQAQLARRREQLLASGVTVAGLLKTKDGVKIDTSKAKEEKKAETKAAKPEPKAEPKAEPVKSEPAKEVAKPETSSTANAGDDEETLLSDWENGFSDSDEDTSAPAESTASSPAETPEPAAQTTKSGDINDLLNKPVNKAKRAEVETRRQARHAKAVEQSSQHDLRSPICAILGHVDTGKTKLLDNMRKTNVQEGEAGGITQQIGATYFPIEMIEKKTEVMKDYVKMNYQVPGLLIIDTPGHESFTNLRTRGSSLCNIAILVVDMHHGLEQQTLESIRLLKDGKTPFVVALNKIDRIFGWEPTPNNNIRDAIAAQSQSVRSQFQTRLEATKLLFAEQGFNSELYYQNPNVSKIVSIVPTSAVTGEGVPDLLYLLLELTQTRMSKQLMYLSELEATILEVKVVEGLGTTIDVVLSNGILNEGDRIVLCGTNGPIATNVRALLTPQPARELRIKSQYIRHKQVKAALGVKISANDLDHAVAGSRLLVVGPNDDEEDLKDEVMDDMTGLLDSVDKGGEGVCVQASTLGSLEALLDFLKQMKIPVMSIGLGPVHKRDVMRCSTMLERKREYALMLCFDVKVDKDAELYAHDNGIKIFTADIIYHLFDDFQKYQDELKEEHRRQHVQDAVFPSVCSIVQVINKRNPMIIGVDVVEGSLRIGTPIAIVKKDPTSGQKLVYPLGRVQSMEVEHKSKDIVRKGQTSAGVAVRLDSGNMTNMPTWGRHIFETDQLYSLITRKSIDTLKDPAFRDDVPREDWLLIKKLKPLFDIK